MFVLYAIRNTLFAIRDDTRHKSLFGKQGKVLNLDHLDFDIVSPVPECCRQGDLELRASYFSYRDTLHASRDTNLFFTTVESPLQIRLFMQNKAKFRKSQMNVNNVLTGDYEKRTLGERGKNEPKTNPIQTQNEPKRTQLKPIKCQNKPNSNPNKANFTIHTLGRTLNISG